MRVTFQEELDQLEASLHEESTLVRRAVRGALNALVRQDPELADEVIAFDDEVDDRYLAIQRGVEAVLASEHPERDDLRLVLAILHVNLHLERIADYCVTIAKLVKLAPEVDGHPDVLAAFEDMGARAEEMTRVALDAFARRDAAGAEALVDLDDLIDRANRRLVEHLLALGPDGERREWGLRMLLVSRALERIGDHAVDIGEQAAFLATGEFREFTDASRPLVPAHA